MIDLPGLRATFEEALTEAGELGTYTYTHGETTPAIDVVLGREQEPRPSSVEGLECVLVFRPDVPMRPMMGGYQETYMVQINLKQWDGERDTLTALGVVVDAIAQIPDLALEPNSIRRVLPLEPLGNIETLSLTVSQTFLVTPD